MAYIKKTNSGYRMGDDDKTEFSEKDVMSKIKSYADGTTDEGIIDGTPEENKAAQAMAETQKALGKTASQTKPKLKSNEVKLNPLSKNERFKYLGAPITGKPLPVGTLTENANENLQKTLDTKGNAIDQTPIVSAKKPVEDKKHNKWWDNVVNGIQGGGLDTALGLVQAGIGASSLNGSQRPISSIDPTFLANADKAQQQASFGFTPEEQFSLNQSNQNALNDARFSARNSGVNPYVLERDAINNSYARGLDNAIAGNRLKQEKQRYATTVSAEKQGMKRQIFEDSLAAFHQKQAAGSNLLNTGISNILDSNRFAQFMKMRGEENDFQNKYGG